MLHLGRCKIVCSFFKVFIFLCKHNKEKKRKEKVMNYKKRKKDIKQKRHSIRP